MKALLYAGLIALAVVQANASDEFACATFGTKTNSEIELFWKLNKGLPLILPFPLESPTPAELPVEPAESFFGHVQRFFAFTIQTNRVTVATSHPEDAATAAEPFKAAGRLFFVDSKGIQRWCTAAFVDNDSTLLTAAHCVWDRANSTFYSNIYFSRAYENGFGENFSIAAIGVLKDWTQAGVPHQFDFAFLTTTQATGSGHMVSGASPNPLQDWIAVGYPRNFVFDGTTESPNGEIMKRARGVAGAANQNMFLMLGNPMGRGTSGGSWNAPGRPPFGNVVFSVSSMLGQKPDSIYGPMLFDTALRQRTLDLSTFVINGCK
jgi:hypothetical protein